MPTAIIYVKNQEKSVWESFKKICDANGWKMSEKIMSYVSEQVSLHHGGGSQTLLDHMGLPKTLPRYKTCEKSDKKLVKGEFYCHNSPAFYRIPVACDSCRAYRDEKK